jgi:hypothetical protein
MKPRNETIDGVEISPRRFIVRRERFTTEEVFAERKGEDWWPEAVSINPVSRTQ